MAKGRQLKGRIRSVQNTRKITKTMELVATSKLKRAQDRVMAARPYAEALRHPRHAFARIDQTGLDAEVVRFLEFLLHYEPGLAP